MGLRCRVKGFILDLMLIIDKLCKNSNDMFFQVVKIRDTAIGSYDFVLKDDNKTIIQPNFCIKHFKDGGVDLSLHHITYSLDSEKEKSKLKN